MSRVVVVGAGMGGLAVAARLARLRHDVVVCEQSATYGGKLGAYERDGFVFDTGPSMLTLPAVYRDLFLKTGKAPLEDAVDLVPVDPAFRYRFADGTVLDVPNASRARIARAMSTAFGSGAGEDWNRLIDHAAEVWRVTRGPFLESPLSGPGDLLRQSRRLSDLRAGRAVAIAAFDWVGATCATRGSACCSTATRPTADRTRDERRPRWR